MTKADEEETKVYSNEYYDILLYDSLGALRNVVPCIKLGHAMSNKEKNQIRITSYFYFHFLPKLRQILNFFY